MEGILVVIGEILVELVLNVVVFAPFDRPTSRWKPGTTNFTLLFVGGGLAALSLLVFGRPIISVAWLRIANLVVAPIVCAFLFRALAERRAKKNFRIVAREHFWHAFWFTLGWVIVRFVFAARP